VDIIPAPMRSERSEHTKAQRAQPPEARYLLADIDNIHRVDIIPNEKGGMGECL